MRIEKGTTMSVALPYQPTDEMSLWWLDQPDSPAQIDRPFLRQQWLAW